MIPNALRWSACLVVMSLLVATGCSGGSDSADQSATPSTSAPAVTEPSTTDGGPATSCGAETMVGDDGPAVAAAVEGLVDELGLTSVLYRITKGDDLVAAGGIGESLPGVPVDPAMHFRIGNVAFGYMGTLLLLLVEDGLAELEDPVDAWLPDLDVPNADSVTLEMLTRNTSGFPDYVGNDDFADQFY